MKSPRAAKLLVVDDHPVVGEGLHRLCAGRPDLHLSGQVPDAGQALAALDRERADLLIVDLRLPDRDGLDLIKAVRQVHPAIQILVYSMFDELVYAERSLRAGAMGYVMKEAPLERLLEGIDSVLSGKVFISDCVHQKIARRLQSSGQRSTGDPVEMLSDRELEVFCWIGQGYKVGAIAEKLGLSPKTIETHQDHAKQKLGIQSAAALSRFAVDWLRSHPDRAKS